MFTCVCVCLHVQKVEKNPFVLYNYDAEDICKSCVCTIANVMVAHRTLHETDAFCRNKKDCAFAKWEYLHPNAFR